MRKVVSHTILTLDGVAVFDAVADTIAELRDTKEVLDDFFGKVANEDAVLLGRVTYQEWADYWPTSTNEPFASHINSVPKFVISRSLEAVPWGTHENATLVRNDLAGADRRLEAATRKEHRRPWQPNACRRPTAGGPARRDAPRDLPGARGQRDTPVQGRACAERTSPR